MRSFTSEVQSSTGCVTVTRIEKAPSAFYHRKLKRQEGARKANKNRVIAISESPER
jgi:hypothetical protein